jgi:uncharacterized protein YdiU (UPF0061 family)
MPQPLHKKRLQLSSLSWNKNRKSEPIDFSEIDLLYSLLQDPYSDQPDMDAYATPPPNWGKHLSVSCSS